MRTCKDCGAQLELRVSLDPNDKNVLLRSGHGVYVHPENACGAASKIVGALGQDESGTTMSCKCHRLVCEEHVGANRPWEEPSIGIIRGNCDLCGRELGGQIAPYALIPVAVFEKLKEPVTLIRFEMVIGDGHLESLFLRPKKIAELLQDPGSLGAFLRDLRDLALREAVPKESDAGIETPRVDDAEPAIVTVGIKDGCVVLQSSGNDQVEPNFIVWSPAEAREIAAHILSCANNAEQ